MTSGTSRGLALLATLGTALALIAPAASAAADDAAQPTPTGTTYYVSAISGNDANDGTSQSTPWKSLDKVNAIVPDLQPGDAVLLEYGSQFTDQYLHITDVAGTPDKPITVSAYGDETKGRPLVAANGVEGSQWYQDYRANVGNHRTHGTVSTTLLLKDVSYITVSNLEITNDDADVHDPIDSWQWTDQADADGTKLDRTAERMDRTGVAGIADNGTTMSHVTLDNLNIHDVDGNLYDKHMANGGIYFMAHLPRTRTSADDDAWLQEHVSRFDHITIRNSTVKDVDRWGIAVGYTAYLNYIDKATKWTNDFNYGDGTIDDDLIAKYGATNVLIENNTITGAGGDAITTMYCDRPVIQHNVGDRVSKHINTADYTANVLNNTGHAGVGYGRVAAGIWPWRCKDPVFQYNEMYSNLNAAHGNGDGQAWDADYGDGTLYQYNYSYGNSFASIMICNQKAINTTFRYNISQNDQRGVFDLPSNGTGNHIYNNTAYIGEDSQVLTNRSNSQARFENNIFINASGTKKTETWNRGSYNGGQTYDRNLYVNYANTPASDQHALKADDVATVLKDAGKGPKAPQASGTVHDRDAADNAFAGYRPAENSPAINAGNVITDMNGYAVEHDFLGKAIKGVPDLGAIESDVVSATMTSSKYETATVGDTKRIYVTFTEKNPVTVGEMLSNVTADKGVDKGVYREASAKGLLDGLATLVRGTKAADKLDDAEPVKEGDLLRFSIDGGEASDEYVVTAKTTWDWVAEYEQGTADHDWKAQRQTKADGEWETIATYDTGYPQTTYNQWYGVGLDYDAFNTNGHKLPDSDKRNDIHGLIAEDPASAGGTAMAWQAPESGTVKVTIKDGEPYLRQDGNNGKKLTLKLMRNSEVLCSAELSQSKQKAESFATCVAGDKGAIAVREGDWIRITADAETGMSKPSVHVSPVITFQDVEPPAGTQAEQYEPAYATTDATVGTAATAAVTFTRHGEDATAPTGATYAIAGEGGVTIDATTGTVTLTPTDAQYGTTVTATVTVTYADKSTDTATVTFAVAQSHGQRYTVRYTPVTLDAGATASSHAPRFLVKADGAAATKPEGTTFALGGEVAGASIDAATGVVTLAAGATGGTVTVPVTVTYPDGQGITATDVTFTVRPPVTLEVTGLETGTADGRKVVYAPFSADSPMTVAQLLAAITVTPDGVTASVVRDGTTLDATAALAADDVLRVGAEGTGLTDEYAIVSKTTWDWVNDFTVNVQGPIWYGQRQSGANAAWSDIADFDGTYPNWMYEQYYGPGVDYQNHSLPADRGSIHGLISDSPATAGGSAIAWKAPKAGTVKVTIKGDEPYLRQTGNNGKKLTLKLMHNDEIVCSADLSVSKQQSTDFATCVTGDKGTIGVQSGDWIRITADAETGMNKPSAHVSPTIAYVAEQTPEPEPEPKPEVDKVELQAAYDEAMKLGDDGSAYTDESWAAFTAARDAAKALLDKADATQTEVDAAKQALDDAVKALAKKDPTPDPDTKPDTKPETKPDAKPETKPESDKKPTIGNTGSAVLAVVIVALVAAAGGMGLTIARRRH